MPKTAMWTRPQYTEAGQPLLRFAVFGNNDVARLDVTSDVPSGIVARSVAPGDLQGLLGQVMLTRLYAGTPAMASARSAASVSLVEGAPEAFEDLAYLRDTIGLVAALAASADDGQGAAILDLNSFHLRTRRDWEEKLHRGTPEPADFVQIFVDEGLDGSMISTRGLLTFGRPDIAFPDVAHGWRDGALAAVNCLIGLAADGDAFDTGQVVEVPGVALPFQLVEGGSPDDPLFNNRHVKIAPVT
ncbi:MAG: hypothetical protein AAFN17_08880 [Pseudomonadota bacterium]